MSIPFSLPAWAVAALAGIWIALALWQLVGRRAVIRSRDAARLERVTATDEGGLAQAAPRPGLADELHQAGLSLSPTTFTLLRLAGAVAALAVVPAFGFPFLVGLGAAALIWTGSRSWVRGKAQGRGRAMDREMPIALSRIAALLDIEKDMPTLLLAVADGLTATNPKSALAEELRRTGAALRTQGVAALADLEARAPSPAVATLAFNLRVFLEAGGEHTALMRQSAARMQRLLETRNQAQTKAAGAMMVARVLPLLLVGVSLFSMRDPQIRAFYYTFFGQALLVAIGGLMLFGYVLMKKMVEDVV